MDILLYVFVAFFFCTTCYMCCGVVLFMDSLLQDLWCNFVYGQCAVSVVVWFCFGECVVGVVACLCLWKMCSMSCGVVFYVQCALCVVACFIYVQITVCVVADFVY